MYFKVYTQDQTHLFSLMPQVFQTTPKLQIKLLVIYLREIHSNQVPLKFWDLDGLKTQRNFMETLVLALEDAI